MYKSIPAFENEPIKLELVGKLGTAVDIGQGKPNVVKLLSILPYKLNFNAAKTVDSELCTRYGAPASDDKIKKALGTAIGNPDMPLITELPIWFVNNRFDEIMPHCYKRIARSKDSGKAKTICEGNGEMAYDFITGQEINCHAENCDYYRKDKCKIVGTLRFCIFDYTPQAKVLPFFANRIGEYMLSTSAVGVRSILNDLRKLSLTVEFANSQYNTHLKLSGLPLLLSMRTITPNKPKQSPYSIPMLSLHPDWKLLLKSSSMMVKTLEGNSINMITGEIDCGHTPLPTAATLPETTTATAAPSVPMITDGQNKKLHALYKERNLNSGDYLRAAFNKNHTNELTFEEAQRAIDVLEPVSINGDVEDVPDDAQDDAPDVTDDVDLDDIIADIPTGDEL